MVPSERSNSDLSEYSLFQIVAEVVPVSSSLRSR